MNIVEKKEKKKYMCDHLKKQTCKERNMIKFMMIDVLVI